MAYSMMDIINRALDYLGQQPLVSLDEPGPGAARARRMWADARDAVLREHVWKCATRRVKLIERSDRPVFGFARRYQLPTDFLRLAGTWPPDARVEVEGDSLLADAADLALAYVAREENPKVYDSALAECLALKLAAEMAFGSTASVTLAQALEEKYERRLRLARNHDAREGDGLNNHNPGNWAKARLG